jgi:hypothetical protein
MNFLKISLIVTSISVASLTVFEKRSFGWGPATHTIIGEIAQSKLTPRARKEIRELFQVRSLGDIANWADKVKNKRKQKPWHYTNIPKRILRYDRR